MKINTKTFSSINYRSTIVGLIMFIVIFAFLFTGFGRLNFLNFKEMDANIALIVGNQKVDMLDFSSLLRSQGYSNSMPENQRKYVVSQILQNLINQKILLNEVEKIGFSTNQADIVVFIRDIKAFQDPNTKQFSLERFKQYLSSQQISEVDFFQKIKDELTIRNMTELLLLSDVYPKNIAKTQYMIDHTEFYLEYALIKIQDSLLDQQANSQTEEFLKNPEHQKELMNLYNSKKNEYNQPTQYKVKSILISYKDAKRAQGSALNRDKQSAQELADSLLIKIQKGTNFGLLATQTNDDPQALQNNGDLGYVDNTKIDDVSYQALSNLTLEKPLSSIIDTPYGFRIFKLEDKKNGVSKTFDDVKTSLAQSTIKQKLKTIQQTELENKIITSLTQSNEASVLNTLLTDQGITWKTFEKPFSIKSSTISELGNITSLAENIYTLKKPGDVIPKILDFGPSKRAIVRLISIRTPNEPTDFDIFSLQKQESESSTQQFAQAYLNELRETYEKKHKIKINPVLLK